MDTINKIKLRKMAIFTFDCSTLFTNVNHNKLKFVLQEQTNFCFKRVSRNYIAIAKFGATWVDDKKNYSILFRKAKL